MYNIDDWQKLWQNNMGQKPLDYSMALEAAQTNIALLSTIQAKTLESWQTAFQDAQSMSQSLITQQSQIMGILMGEGSPEDKIAEATDMLQELHKKTHKQYRGFLDKHHELSGDLSDMLAKHMKIHFKELKSMIDS